jgi:hypothetical protein
MLKITAEEIHFILYQYLHESGKSKIPHFQSIFHLPGRFKEAANYSGFLCKLVGSNL